MKLHVICNPTSGNGAGKSIGQRVEQLLAQKGVPASFSYTEHALQAIELSHSAVNAGADTVAAIGGDGTLHEVAQGLIGTGASMGIIPAGTGNDYIKSLNIPLDPEKALDIILNKKSRPVDTVCINDRVFLNECGCGFDVMVLDYAENAKKYVKGILPYLHGVIQTILHFNSIKLHFSIDDGPEQNQEILVLGVGNGRFIGGGIPIAPTAIPDDGMLDVVLVSSMSKSRMFSVLPGLLKGRILSFPETKHVYAKSIHVWGKGLRVNVDGEIITLDEAEIRINPASLLVHRP